MIEQTYLNSINEPYSFNGIFDLEDKTHCCKWDHEMLVKTNTTIKVARNLSTHMKLYDSYTLIL